MKVCNTCGLEKPLNEFSKSRNSYRSTCKQCRAENIYKHRHSLLPAVRVACLYKLVHKPTGAFYIGTTLDIFNRQYQHFLSLKKHSNAGIRKLAEKSKTEDFEVIPIKQCALETRFEEERELIKLNQKNTLCLNIAHSLINKPAVRQKVQAQVNSKAQPNKGLTFTDLPNKVNITIPASYVVAGGDISYYEHVLKASKQYQQLMATNLSVARSVESL